jgi:glycosyltransferase involved in cell wall biosynthesis
MKISFIIPVYNAAEYLNKCVDSIFQSDLEDGQYEIILVDDGSTDNSVAVAQQICAAYSQVSWYTQKNQGSSVARNAGIGHAAGDYVWFVDSDDYLDSSQLKGIYNDINVHQGLDLYAIQLQIIDGETIRKECSQPSLKHNAILKGRDAVLRGYQPSSACALICRLEWLKNNTLKFYPGISHQDVEFTMRAMALAKTVYFSKYTPYLYFKHSGSVSRAQNAEKLYFYMIGDMYVALSYKKFAESLSDSVLKSYIAKWSNSILVNLLLSLKRASNPLIDRNFKERVISDLKVHRAYPVRGPFFSGKIYLLSKLLNIKYFILS